ncbi:glycosyltransferase family 4 protein (plasmid) [Ruegeria sp. SCSIO 43209]|uniref:glycosyltransferase family 4 protein n=1 Tax=Ruegeria sp. SCSIO 43209 TaxID=2793010 RepID=UPI00147BE08D|nr:glycosyltransferase family 4 protein [Ruegeria sp. SCSIO 43209]UAB91721.1 glycosyltransferase family 4 protein [Ruegeria sp. SCSIO 43209]
MRVAYLINQYPAISHTFIRREIRALEDMGVEVERFALRGWDSDVVDTLDREEMARTRHTLKDGTARLILGALVWGLRHPQAFLRGLKLAFLMSKGAIRPWPYHLIYLAHACRIMTWLEGKEVSHLHAHFGSNSAEIAALVEALSGPGFSFTTHGSEVFDDPKRHALPLKVDRARFAVTSCAYIGSQMMYNVPPALWSKVNVVHCGLAATAFANDATPLPDAPIFLSVGRFSPEKGHLLLIEAFAAVHAAHPGARLVLAGDGPMRAMLEDHIAQLNLEQAVRITGWVTSDQVRAELRGARALVHPSFTEGLPVVIMEAMAEYRPVISTYIAGIPELVQDGQTGWLVPAGQVKDLTMAMLACADMPAEKLEAMGQAGFDRVRARHDASVEAAKLKALFKALGS